MARLTTMARGGGCGCKLGKSALAEALALMPARRPTPACWWASRGPTTRRPTACATTSP